MTRNAQALQPLPLLALLGFLAGAATVLPAAQEPASPAVPGMVRIPAGDAVIGRSEKEIQPMLDAERNPDNRWVMGGEVGRHTVSLPEYWIAPTHVTNEMYLEYVKASGARPPATWAKLSKEEIEQLLLIGKTAKPGYKWDEETQGEWWSKHWMDAGVSWEMPPSRALDPVVFVNYEEAQAYCTWAGLRLPTEEEIIRAGRGEQVQDYPFGNEFDRAAVAHNATTPSAIAFKRVPVGMFPVNRSSFGVLDLVGNVWSWTTSVYLPYPEFPREGLYASVLQPGEKRPEKLRVSPNWDASRKVLKGGNFSAAAEFCRLDVRLGMDPGFAVSVIGFRVASSGAPAADAATMRALGVRSSVLGFSPDRDLDRSRVLGVERRIWPDMAEIEARRMPPEKPFKQPELPPDYRVFGPCEVLAIAPLVNPFEREDYPETQTIEKAAMREFIFPTLGVFTTSVALAEPALPAGNYVLAWMPAFKDRELLELGALLPEKDMPKTPVTPDEVKMKRAGLAGRLILPGKEHLLFLDEDGNAAGAVPLLVDFKLQAEKTVRHDMELDLAKQRWTFWLKLPGKTNKAYGLSFAVETADAVEMTENRWQGDYGVRPPAKKAIQAEQPK